MTSPTEPWTVLRLLDWTTEHFKAASLDSPRLCAELLLARAMDCKRLDLYTRFSYQPTDAEKAAFRQTVKQAAEGMPVAYLLEEKEFYSLKMKVTPAVLIPRPETELLVDQAILYARQHPGELTIWDVCTGSGCIASAVAKNIAQATLLATDLSEDALAVARENINALELADRITLGRADGLTVPAEWAGEWTFDIILSNPPYVAEGDPLGRTVDREPKMALFAGDDGLNILRPLIAAVGGALKSGGLFAVEFGQGQADAVRDLIVATEQFDEPTIIRDHQNIERIATAVRK